LNKELEQEPIFLIVLIKSIWQIAPIFILDFIIVLNHL